MAKCAACDSTILLGGVSYHCWRFCDEACQSTFLIGLAGNAMNAQEIEEAVETTFRRECPECQGAGPIDVYGTTKVTGMLIAFKIGSEEKVCCSGCGRKLRLGGFAHCLLLGWWSPKALVCNVFVLPYTLIRAIFTMPPKEPSKKLKATILETIGRQLAPGLARKQREAAAEGALLES